MVSGVSVDVPPIPRDYAAREEAANAATHGLGFVAATAGARPNPTVAPP